MNIKIISGRIVISLLFITFGCVIASFAAASRSVVPQSGVLPVANSAQDKSVFSDYKGIFIGTGTEAVRSKLGDPKDTSDGMDMYIFSDEESAQFYYDDAKKVKAILITYSGDLKKAPVAKAILGEDVEPKPDGGIFKMNRYPKAGYWVSYNRTAGDQPIIIIAVQKL